MVVAVLSGINLAPTGEQEKIANCSDWLQSGPGRSRRLKSFKQDGTSIVHSRVQKNFVEESEN